jgi:hypothetical protein
MTMIGPGAPDSQAEAGVEKRWKQITAPKTSGTRYFFLRIDLILTKYCFT